MTNEQIITELGLNDISGDAKDKIVDQVQAVVEMRLLGVLQETMNDSQMEEFKDIQDSGESVVTEWVNAQFSNIDELRESITRDYIEERKSTA